MLDTIIGDTIEITKKPEDINDSDLLHYLQRNLRVNKYSPNNTLEIGTKGINKTHMHIYLKYASFASLKHFDNNETICFCLVNINNREYILREDFIRASRINTNTECEPLKVSIKVHNRLSERYQFFLERGNRTLYYGTDSIPLILMLGKDEDDIIIDTDPVETDGGCSSMPSIDASSIAKSMYRLHKKRITPCGIARISSLLELNSPSSRGYGLGDLFHIGTDSIMVTVAKNGIDAKRIGYKGNSIYNYAYSVVQMPKRRYRRKEYKEVVTKIQTDYKDPSEKNL